MLAFAGSTVVPFSSACGTVLPESRMSAKATASWASLYTGLYTEPHW